MDIDNKIISKTFFWMFLGLLGTALVGWYAYSTELYISILNTNTLPIIAIVEVVVVLVFSFLFRKLPPIAVGILYFIYAFINGFSFSIIFAAFDLGSIVFTFFLTAILFATLAICGYTTNIDISKWSTILFVALLVSLIASIINIFLGNGIVDIILDWIIIFIFAGYTIYDMHMLKTLQNDSTIDQEKVYIYCAMQLYLDFINLFIRLLSRFGKSKD